MPAGHPHRFPSTPRASACARPPARAVVLAVVLAVWGLLGAGPAPPSGAQPRRALVVGDSTILGAAAQVEQGFRAAGWDVAVDAAVSRSTAAGAEVVAARSAEPTDTLVVALGANDAGSTETFRQRVRQVLAAAGAVPRVLWLTIPEVRPYYPAANQVLRDAAASDPRLTVVDWHLVAGQPGMTASDGLHLTATGARAMSFLVVAAAVGATAPPPVPAAPPPTAAPTTAPPPPDTVPVTTTPPATTVPSTTVPPMTAPPTTDPPATEPARGRQGDGGGARRLAAVPARAAAAPVASPGTGPAAGAATRAGVAAALLLAALAVALGLERRGARAAAPPADGADASQKT